MNGMLHACSVLKAESILWQLKKSHVLLQRMAFAPEFHTCDATIALVELRGATFRLTLPLATWREQEDSGREGAGGYALNECTGAVWRTCVVRAGDDSNSVGLLKCNRNFVLVEHGIMCCGPVHASNANSNNVSIEYCYLPPRAQMQAQRRCSNSRHSTSHATHATAARFGQQFLRLVDLQRA